MPSFTALVLTFTLLNTVYSQNENPLLLTQQQPTNPHLISCTNLSVHQETRQVLFYNEFDFLSTFTKRKYNSSTIKRISPIIVLIDLSPNTVLSSFSILFDIQRFNSDYNLYLNLYYDTVNLYLIHLNYKNIKEIIYTKLNNLLSLYYNGNKVDQLIEIPISVFNDLLLELLNNDEIASGTKVYPLNIKKHIKYKDNYYINYKDFNEIKQIVSFRYYFEEFCPLVDILGHYITFNIDFYLSYINNKCTVDYIDINSIFNQYYSKKELHKLSITLKDIKENKINELLNKVLEIYKHPTFTSDKINNKNTLNSLNEDKNICSSLDELFGICSFSSTQEVSIKDYKDDLCKDFNGENEYCIGM